MTEETQPWPRAQRMPRAIVGGRVQPWHYQAIVEYDEARGETTEYQSAHCVYTAQQVNNAIDWWNERVAAVGELELPLRLRAKKAAEKIRARVAEDQCIAQYAGGRQWRVACRCGPVHEDNCFVRRVEGDDIIIYDEGGHDEDQARHIVRNDPAHVLARSATLLDVLAELERIADHPDHPDPRMWARTAICGLARAWELDDDA